MDKQYNQNWTQQGYSQVISNGQAPQQENRKKFLLKVGAALLLLVVATVAIILISNNSNRGIIDDIEPTTFTYSQDERYSDLLNLFANLNNDITEDRIRDTITALGLDDNYLQLNHNTPTIDNGSTVDDEDDEGDDEGDNYSTDDETPSFISSTKIDPSTDYSGQNIEYISFNHIPEDDDEPVDRYENFTYHNYTNGEHHYIYQSSDNEFTHQYGEYANSFNNLIDAIDDYVGRL